MAASVVTPPRPNAVVERVLARLVDPQPAGEKRWTATCPVHGDGCALAIVQRRDGGAQLTCGRNLNYRHLVKAIGLTPDDVAPPVKLAPDTLAKLDAEVLGLEHDLAAALLDNTDAVAGVLLSRRFDPAIITSPFYRAIVQVGLAQVQTLGGIDVKLLVGDVARLAGGAVETVHEDVGLLLGDGADIQAIGERCRRLEVVAARRQLFHRFTALRSLAVESDLSEAELIGEARTLVEETAAQVQAAVPVHAPSLRELLQDPAILEEPVCIAPRLAWRGRATLLSGPEKEGKSSYLGAAAAAVSRGDAFLGVDVPAGDVLWLALDEPKADAVRRLVKHQADPDRVFVCDRAPHGFPDVERLIRQHRPALVVLDSLAAYAAGQVESMNSRSEMTRVLLPLCYCVRDVDAALVVVHHDKKTGGYSDSQAIGATVDVILQWTNPETQGDRTRRDVAAKGRVSCASYSVRLELDGRYAAVDRQELPLEARIIAYLGDNPLASKLAIEQAMGGRAEKVRAALDALQRAGQVVDMNVSDNGSRRMRSAAYSLTSAARQGTRFDDRRAYGDSDR